MSNSTQPDEEYHAQKWASSSSLLKKFADTPRHFQWSITHPEDGDTDAKRKGRLIHAAILQPHVFKERYVSDHHLPKHIREMNKNTTIYKTAKKELLEAFPAAMLISEAHAEMAAVIIDRCWSNQKIVKLLEGSAMEVSAFCADLETACWVKARFDSIKPSLGAFTDVKSTTDLSPRHFAAQVLSYGWPLQVAHYQRIAKRVWNQSFPNPFWIGVESVAPFDVRLFQVPKEYVDQGEVERAAYQYQYAQCLENNDWPGYPSTVETLPPIPKWYGKTEEG